MPCREGIKQALAILERITRGEGREEDIATLEEIGAYQVDSSLCALGQSASNPVLSTIRYFRDEYETHIRDHYCPSGVCKSLFRYLVNAEACTGCMACKKECPVNAIEGERKQPHVIKQDALHQVRGVLRRVPVRRHRPGAERRCRRRAGQPS